ncbi:MAG TPA: hypothetical protein VHM25_23270, partial [Polyangiaceae bacterium]|nr:hypothetical protein [Polyangiaceae bacterium]
IDDSPGVLDGLLELAARDEAAGLGDAPWPPHFRKMAGEGTRVAPSRAKANGAAGRATAQASKTPAKKPAPRSKAPLIVVARSPDRDAALAGLERWKRAHPEIAAMLAVDDVLVDSMRGRSTNWTRVRINLRHVPEPLRPEQAPPDPDDDPTAHRRARSSHQ